MLEHLAFSANVYTLCKKNDCENRLGLGGPAVGFLTGMIGSFAIGYILEDHLSEITLTVVVCFSSFLLAEATPIKVGWGKERWGGERGTIKRGGGGGGGRKSERVGQGDDRGAEGMTIYGHNTTQKHTHS